VRYGRGQFVWRNSLIDKLSFKVSLIIVLIHSKRTEKSLNYLGKQSIITTNPSACSS